MRYAIENEFIRLTIDSLGAEMVSVIDRATGSEMIWCADPAVWNRHAPILFPYAGKLTGGHFKASDGKLYEKNLLSLGLSREAFDAKLKKSGIESYKNIFLAFFDENKQIHAYLASEKSGGYTSEVKI